MHVVQPCKDPRQTGTLKHEFLRNSQLCAGMHATRAVEENKLLKNTTTNIGSRCLKFVTSLRML